MRELIKRMILGIHENPPHDKEYDKIYGIHKYWSRKPWYVVEQYILKYSAEGDVVFDPFCGSGCTGLEAIINGRDFVGQDLNPISLKISSGTMNYAMSEQRLLKYKSDLSKDCETKIMNLYKSDSSCDTCGNSLFFNHINNGPKFHKAITGALYCPNCSKKVLFKRPLTQNELKISQDLEKLELPYWVPEVSFPEKFYKDRFSYKGVKKVTDLYTKRNLYALSLILHNITQIPDEEVRELFLLAFTNTVLHASKLKGENVRPLGVNNYWIPDDYFEENVWFRFEYQLDNMITSRKTLAKRLQHKKCIGKYSLKKISATEPMGSSKYDYIFTDPPYGEAIQYSELSFVWNAWLQKEYDTSLEIIINPEQKKGKQEFNDLLSQSLINIFDSLKDGHYFTLCFQNKEYDVWHNTIKNCKEIGLKLVDIQIYDTFGSPFNKNWAKYSPKSDIYVTFQKKSSNDNDYYYEEFSLNSVIQEIINYAKQFSLRIDHTKVFDLVISLLLWNLYYNQYMPDRLKFDLKKLMVKIDEELSRLG